MIHSFSKMAFKTLMVACLTTAAGWAAQASELDNEHQFSAEQLQIAGALPKTVVIRVKVGSKQAEVLQTNEALGKDAAAHRFVSTSSFIKVDGKGTPVNELDRESSTSSFGFHFGFGGGHWGGGFHFGGGFGGGWGGFRGFNPGYSYYGYSYPYYPYYSYINNGYQYAYYGWPYGGYNPYCGSY